MKVLIVDDSPVMRRFIKKSINDLDGFEVVGEGRDGNEAIELFKKFSPDIITLDLIMPVMGGFDAADKILEIAKDSKILLLTSIKDNETVERAKKMGITHILQKPFSPSELIDTLKEMTKE